MAERNSSVVSSEARYKEGRVIVAEEKNSMTLGTLSPNRLLLTDVAGDIRRVAGVAKITPQVMLPLESEEGIPIGQPKTIAGGYMGTDMQADWRFTDGRGFSEDDRGVAVVGSNLVRNLKARVGKRIRLRGQTFRVVGLLDSTLSSLDGSVLVPLAAAQAMYLDSLPESFQARVKAEDLAVALIVYRNKGTDPDALAGRINKRVKGVIATGPTAWRNQANGMSALLAAVALFAGAVALSAGGLLVVNAMMMSVSERTREVGVERAMGASTGRVAREVLAQALVIGTLGGLAGLAAGAVAIYALNAALAGSALVLFAVTPRLAAVALIYSLGLSGLGGLYPAWHAARLNPVAALAYE